MSISRETAFRILAFGALGAAFYHLLAAFGIFANSPSPPAKHLLFVAIDVALAWYLIKRPRWFFPVFLVLLIQQTVTHGQSIAERFHRAGQFDVLSVVDLAWFYMALALLIIDMRKEQ